MSVLEWVLVGGGMAMAVGITWFLVRRSQSTSSSSDQMVLSMHQTLSDRLDNLVQHLDYRLQQNVHAMNESKSFLADRVNNAEATVRQVHASLGRLEQATASLHKTNQDIAKFQDMLRHPKMRGNFGEVLLGNLLADVLPKDRYELQHTFTGSGEIADAIIRLQDGYLVAIDAKFPLAHYEAYVHEKDPARQKAAKTAFVRDVKRHIEAIGSKYIVPQEYTLNFAFMYIPMEGVYYETMVHDPEGENIWNFCLERSVIPVSPNSFLAYLQTILVGLRGMKVQEQAQEILRHLGQIRQDMGRFGKDFSMIGSHLSNAKNRYEDSVRRFDRLTDRLDHIDTGIPSNTGEALPEQSLE